MKAALVAIILSGWDSHFLTSKPIGTFDTYVMCQNARAELLKEDHNLTRYVCVNAEK